MAKYVLVDPSANEPQQKQRLAPRVGNLRGKRIGIRIRWKSFDVFMEEVGTVLARDHGVGELVLLRLENVRADRLKRGLYKGTSDLWIPAEGIDDFASRIDAAILGLCA